jgi:hypothetical protein
VALALSAPVDTEPLRGSLPDQAPEASQALALVEDQVSVAALPLVSVLGLALSVRVGVGDFTVTVADCTALPPAPEQVKVYVAFALSAPVDTEPLVASLPDQAPEAVQAVAWVLDQVTVALAPLAIVLGAATRLMVGAGVEAVTETVTLWVALPPKPVQVSP